MTKRKKKIKPVGPPRRWRQRLFGAAREKHNAIVRRMPRPRANPPLSSDERRRDAWFGRVHRAGIDEGRVDKDGRRKKIKKGVFRWSLRRNNVDRDKRTGRFTRRR